MTKLTVFFRLLIIVICYGILSPASAQMVWRTNGVAAYETDNPTASCQKYTQANFGSTRPFHSIVFVSNYPGDGMPNKYDCMHTHTTTPTDPPQRLSYVSRYGSSCVAPLVVDKATGTCKPPVSCQTGFIKNAAGECVPEEPVCKAGEKWVVSATFVPKNHGGCAVTIVQLLQCYTVNGATYCKWEVERTGAKAADDVPDSLPPSDQAPPPVDGPRVPSPPLDDPTPGKGCPVGTVQAGQTASGTPICIGSGTNTSAPPTGGTQTTSSPPVVNTAEDGTTTTIQTGTATNADGSTTTTVTTTVVKPDGTKEVTANTSTSNTAGGTQGTADGVKEGKGFCELNPNLSVCRESSVNGSCGQVSCTGDAIQCATLRAAAAMECRDKEASDFMKASPLTTLGNQIGSGADPVKGQIDELIKGTEVDLSNPNLDESGFLGGGSAQCLAPMVFSVSGRAVSYNFDALCGHIQPLRLLILAICSILSYLVVGRSVVGGS